MEKSERLDKNLHLNFSQTSLPEVSVSRGSLRMNILSIPSLTSPVQISVQNLQKPSTPTEPEL